MANVTPVVPSNTSPTVLTSNSASGGGDKVKNSKGRTLIRVFNGGGSSITMTINPVVATRPADGVYPLTPTPTIAAAVAAGTSVVVGPIKKAYNDASDDVNISWSATTSVVFEAIEFEP